jgi:hypothetical protein
LTHQAIWANGAALDYIAKADSQGLSACAKIGGEGVFQNKRRAVGGRGENGWVANGERCNSQTIWSKLRHQRGGRFDGSRR